MSKRNRSYEELLNNAKKRATYLGTDTSDVNDAYIKAFDTDWQNYYNGLQGAYDSLNWGNATSTYEAQNKAWQDLSERANKIGAYYYQNRNRYGNDAYTSVDDYISQIQSGGSSIINDFKSVMDFYNQFAKQEDYDLWQADQDFISDITSREDYQTNKSHGEKRYSQKIWEDMWKVYDDNTNNAIGDLGDKKSLGELGKEIWRSMTPASLAQDAANLVGDWASLSKMKEQLSDDELGVYYYLLETDPAQAEQYFRKYADIANQRKASGVYEKINNNLGETGISFLAGLESFGIGFNNALSALYGKDRISNTTVNQYASAYASQDNNETFGRKVLQVANDLAQTLGNQLPSIALNVVAPGAGIVTMGASAAGNAYAEMKQVEGISEAQAIAYGVTIGVLESTLQQALGGISGLGSEGGIVQNAVKKALPKITSGFARAVVSLGANMADEGIEEAAQTALEPLMQWLWSGDIPSQYQSEEDFINHIGDIAYSGFLGALSAGVIEGGLETLPNSVSISQNAKKQYGGITSDLVNDILSKDANNKLALAMKSRLDAGKKVSGLNIAELVKQGDSTAIKSAIVQKLTERGERTDIGKLSQALTKEAMGEDLTRGEKNLIKSSDFGRSIQAELNPTNLYSDMEMDRWAEKIGTRETNAKVYNKQVQVKSIKEDGKVELENGKIVSAEKVTLPNESDDLIFRNATERIGRVDGWTNETANAMVKGYDGTIPATIYRSAYVSAFEMGKRGASTSELMQLKSSTKINSSTLLAAYDMGAQASEKSLTSDTESGTIKESEADNESNGVRVRESGKRNRSEDSEKQVSRVEESTRDAEKESSNKSRKVADSEAVKLVDEGRKVSVADLGILNGSKTQKVTIVEQSQETSKMKEARKLAESRGLKVRFFLGDNLLMMEKGELISVRGYILGDTVLVRADHPDYTADQIMRHEVGHDMIAKGEVDIDAVREKLKKLVGEENIDLVADAYANAYEKTNMTADEIWEECICDSLGDMNIFADVEKGNPIIQEIMTQIKETTESEVKAPTNPRASPEGKASGEMFTLSKAYIKDVHKDDRASFSRILADKTVNIEDGQKKYIEINGARRVYFFVADGYMRGEIIKSVSNKRPNLYIKAKGEFYDSIKQRGEGADIWVEFDYLIEKGNSQNFRRSEYEGRTNRNDSLFEKSPTSNSGRSKGRDVEYHYSPEEAKANIKYSREIDSAGNELTEAQVEYFKDSKVRDENGNLYVVYHGSGNKFTEFKHSKIGAHGTSLGKGFYFTEDVNLASSFQQESGQLLKGYLDIKKPLVDGEKTIKKAEVTKLIKAICEAEAKYLVENDEYDNINDAIKDTFISNYVNTYVTPMANAYREMAEQVYRYNDSDADIIGELINGGAGASRVLREVRNMLGYDGVIFKHPDGTHEFVAFESNQFKNADNLTPTKNPDIRYSRELDFVESVKEDAETQAEISNRELLVNALSTTVQNEVEQKKLDEYRDWVDKLNAREKKLVELKKELKELTSGDKEADASKIKELKEEIRKTENRIDFHDKKLLQLESTQALKNVLQRARRNSFRAAMQKARENYHEKVEGRHKTVERNAIKDIAHELDKVLNKGNKKRNVKIGAQPIVQALLDVTDRLLATDDELIMSGIVTETTDVEDAALANYRALYNEYHSTDNDVTNHKEERKALRQEMNEVKKELSDLLTRERKRISKAKASDSMQTLIDEYHKLESAEEDYLKLAYKQEVYEHLVSLKDNLGDKLVSEMSLDDLKDLHKACTMIYKMVTSSNKLFREGKYQNIKDIVDPIFKEISDIVTTEKDVAKMVGDLKNFFAKLRWDNLRPVDAFENIGSETLTRLYWDAIDAQDKYGAAVEEIGDAIINARKKYGYKKWDINKTQTFKTADGNFQITLGEMMSIYAYSKRKQADKHMREGGFTHEKNASYKDKNGRIILRHDAKRPYRLGDKSLVDISSALTAQQKEYVDTIVEFMTKYGEKGNEVSRIMYGIDLFTETWYFPLKSSADFLPSATDQMGKVQTTASLSNIGMTKATVPNANNPIVLRSFDDVVFEHLDSMAKYNAYVIPIDNLRKVFDSYDSNTNMALKSLIRSNIGQGAEEYLKKYITDLNGGIVTEQGSLDKVMKVFSNTKAATVLANTSVWIQQFFSIIRAATLLHPKYFIPYMGNSYKNPNNLKIYEEMKRYAPITVIKEMGGFDVGSNKGLSSYIGYNESKLTMGKFMSKVNDIFGIGASLMDKVGWITIWKVVKKEVASTGKFKEGSDAYFEACRKRMNEVITKTQVYDSVNSRSAHMRNKSSLAKMLTSYMGEPTVIVGMLDTAFVKTQRALVSKDKGKIKKASSQLATTVVWVTISTAMTSIMKSIPYANRDDDEDETWWEKYFEALASSFAQDLNLMNYIPLFRDISSIVNGFTVERGDMQAIADAINDIKKLWEDTDKSTESWDTTWTEVVKVVGSVSTLFGIPARNIMRELEAIKNTVDTIGRKYNSDIGGALKQGFSSGDFIGSLITGEDGKTSKSEKLYSAFVRGDTERLDYYKTTYEDDKSYESALRKSLRDNDPRVEQAALARLNRDNNTYYNLMMDIIEEGIFDRTMVKEAFEAEYNYQKKKAEEEAE